MEEAKIFLTTSILIAILFTKPDLKANIAGKRVQIPTQKNAYPIKFKNLKIDFLFIMKRSTKFIINKITIRYNLE